VITLPLALTVRECQQSGDRDHHRSCQRDSDKKSAARSFENPTCDIASPKGPRDIDLYPAYKAENSKSTDGFPS